MAVKKTQNAQYPVPHQEESAERYALSRQRFEFMRLPVAGDLLRRAFIATPRNHTRIHEREMDRKT